MSAYESKKLATKILAHLSAHEAEWTDDPWSEDEVRRLLLEVIDPYLDDLIWEGQ